MVPSVRFFTDYKLPVSRLVSSSLFTNPNTRTLPLFRANKIVPFASFSSKSNILNMEKICVYGSGNWGSTAVRFLADNAAKYDCFDNTVNMYVHCEIYNGRDLTEIINTDKENPKYLPGFKFPDNIVATSDIKQALDG
ncbi:Glycerol-3-phosphate dehydrogenase 1-like protein, partial [Smittium mucronatum]